MKWPERAFCRFGARALERNLLSREMGSRDGDFGSLDFGAWDLVTRG